MASQRRRTPVQGRPSEPTAHDDDRSTRRYRDTTTRQLLASRIPTELVEQAEMVAAQLDGIASTLALDILLDDRADDELLTIVDRIRARAALVADWVAVLSDEPTLVDDGPR